MKDALVSLLRKVSYLNVILTIIAILLFVQLVHELGFLQVRDAHAASPLPVRIDSVSSNIPVAIKDPMLVTLFGGDKMLPVAIKSPLATNGSVCANPCR